MFFRNRFVHKHFEIGSPRMEGPDCGSFFAAYDGPFVYARARIEERDEDGLVRLLPTPYVTTKYALCRWVRRISASWAARGVIINAVAPGGVDTDIIPNMKADPRFETTTLAFPMPTVYRAKDLMRPETVAEALVCMVTGGGRGCCGAILYCDGGSNAILHSETYL